jgi:group I intron endonuclease
MHLIYVITNIINNKIYIGQTNNPKLRWSQHKSNAKYNRGHQVITRAISKYGSENFTFEVIASCQDQKDADKAEEEIIIQRESRNPDKGYNVDAGGNTTPRTPEVLKKISDGLKRFYAKNHNHMKGKKLSDEWKSNIAKSSVGKRGTNSGKKFDDSWRLKISKSQIGKERKTKRRFPDNIEKEMCRLYLEDKRSMYSLAKEFKCNRTLIADILQRNNITTRQSNNVNKKYLFSFEQELNICKEYVSGNISRSALGKKFGCSKTTIREILLRHGVKF